MKTCQLGGKKKSIEQVAVVVEVVVVVVVVGLVVEVVEVETEDITKGRRRKLQSVHQNGQRNHSYTIAALDIAVYSWWVTGEWVTTNNKHT